jgi:hypothetical protein
MSITGGFTFKGTLNDGELLAESTYVHMTEVAKAMKAEEIRSGRRSESGDRILNANIRTSDEHEQIMRKFGSLENQYYQLTGRHPKFPEV